METKGLRNTYVDIRGMTYENVMELANIYSELTGRPIEDYLVQNKDDNTIFEPFYKDDWDYLIASKEVKVHNDVTDVQTEISESFLRSFK